jgi:GTP pyrophosphokinase
MRFEDRVAWLRQLIDWHRELSGAEEFLESVKTDLFIDQVFVYTPKGEIKDLPKGSTPLDFAYQVHTELGHRCIGAKVNGQLVPLNHQLNNGDIVEIMTAKGAKGPSRDWLTPHLGYVRTSQAKTKIRQWFKRQQRTENIERGRQLLENELRHLGVEIEREELAHLFYHSNLNDFLAAIGCGEITTHQVAVKLAAQQPPAKPVPEVAVPPPAPSAVRVLGEGNLVTHIAQCCHPVLGDRIVGYITRGRGVTIHRQDCYNVIYESEKARLVPADWEPTDSVYPVSVEVKAWDRVGLIRDITTVVAEEKVNIAEVNFTNHEDYTTSTFLTLEVKDLAQLSRLLVRIEGVRAVIGVSRVGDEVTGKTSPKKKG